MEKRDVQDPRTRLEPELIFIPGGRFIMGSDKKQDPEADDHELPQHVVTVGDFYIAKYPITNAEYARFVAETGHKPPEHWNGEAPPEDIADHPVVSVSWHDANAYCAWLSQATRRPYRLPSEAEWEKAARGTDGRIYPSREPPARPPQSSGISGGGVPVMTLVPGYAGL
jgi:serine/threonine-protein kinase